MKKPSSDSAKSRTFVPGEDFGKSPWIVVDQNMISKFGEATLDQEAMHIDPKWSEEHSPYGGTIAFGFLTASLLTHMLHSTLGTSTTWLTEEQGYFLNYGIDYLRFMSPVPVNSRIRGHFKVLDNRFDAKGRNIVKFGCEVEIEGDEKPALIAEWLSIFISLAEPSTD